MKKCNKLILGMVCVCLSFDVLSADVSCSGKVKSLSYHADNKLMVQLDSMNVAVFFCSPESEWTVGGTNYKTGPDTCRTMHSTFLAAQTVSYTHLTLPTTPYV